MDDGAARCASSPPSRPHTPTEDIPVTGVARVKDVQPPIMLHNPHHATSTTVEYLPDEESHILGGHMANFKAAIERAGRNGQGQLQSTPPGTMGDGETRCPVFCTADIPATTLDLLLECTEEYLSEFNSPNYTAHVSDRLVIIDTKDIGTITKGSSPPIASCPTTFLGLSLSEVRDWFDANITQPLPEGFTPHCLLVIDDKSTEDNSCIFVCTQDSTPGEIHSLRCGFEVALENVVVCDVQGRSMEEGLMGSFMRSGVTMTKENLKLAQGFVH